MLIRAAFPEDALAIANVHVSAWCTAYRGLLPDSVIAAQSVEQREVMWREAAEAALENAGRSFVLVAEDRSDGIIGFASAGPEREEGTEFDSELYAIYLLEHHQGCGVGRQLARRAAGLLLEQVSERPGLTVVWAHNEHVAVNPDFFGSAALGYFLREEPGADYVALGMLFGEGSFLARSFSDRLVREWRVERAGPEHVEQLFAGNPLGIYGTGSFEEQGMLYDPMVARQQPEHSGWSGQCRILTW